MKIVIQRVSRASVSVEGKEIVRIGRGLLLLVGIAQGDTNDEAQTQAKKIASMRIFSDEDGKLNYSLIDIAGDALIVSQFTLIADTKKGNRPSFSKAATPEHANTLYTSFINELKSCGAKRVEKGVFGAYMDVSLVNDGPVTIVL